MTPPRVALVGLHGYGGWHLRNVLRLHSQGVVVLAAVCDPRPPTDEITAQLPAETTVHRDVASMLTVAPEITVLASPPHTHLELSRLVLEAGSDLLLEKPPVLDLSSLDTLIGWIDRTGRSCQVGFQTMGSGALTRLRELVAAGTLGELTGIGAAGRWVRTDAYYSRADWAGRRRLAGRPVVDGTLTNPFAHAVQTALVLAGAERTPYTAVELELFRARDIEADDTASARLSFAEHPEIVAAFTLCAQEHGPPYLVAHGSRGRAVLEYTTDRLLLGPPGAEHLVEVAPRTDLLENLVSHRAAPDRVPLLCPPERTRTFTAMVQAVGAAPPPALIPAAARRVEGEGPARRVIVSAVDEAVAAAAEGLRLFSELDDPMAPWISALNRLTRS